MNRLLAIATLLAIPVLEGCVTVRETQTGPPPIIEIASLSDDELRARHVQLSAELVEIKREVEFKAGLPMGVAISDGRGRLVDLHKAISSIESELQRRQVLSQEGLRARL